MGQLPAAWQHALLLASCMSLTKGAVPIVSPTVNSNDDGGGGGVTSSDIICPFGCHCPSDKELQCVNLAFNQDFTLPEKFLLSRPNIEIL